MKTPKISIITATYNCNDSIEKTILSVLSQDYGNIEYIVIDGGSTDGTLDCIKQYSDRISYWISEQDEGLYDALNKGIKMASGDWIGLLNSGDLFHSPHTISELFEKEIPSSIGVVYGDCILIDGEKSIYRKAVPSTSLHIPPAYRHGASFVKAEVHKCFLFDLSQKEKFGYGLDYLHICTMRRNKILFLYRNVTVLDYLKDGMSNHPLKNKYLQALAESNGKYNFFFITRLLYRFYNAIMNKIKNSNETL